MAHYPTLAYSQFGVRADALPAHLRPPPALDVRTWVWSHHICMPCPVFCVGGPVGQG